MIFVIGEALVNLRASNIGKTVRDGIDCFAVLQKADHVVHTDACSFDPRVTAANSLSLHDVAIVGRRFHLSRTISQLVARSTSEDGHELH